MTKKSRIWMAENVVRSGVVGKDRVLRKTLKAVCGDCGVAYGTAKRRQDREGGSTSYVLGNGETWVLWREEVK